MVSEAASSGLLETVLICDEKDEIRGIENVLVTEEIIGKLAQSQAPQKIIGVCRFLPRGPLAGKRFLLLDGISAPGNMGTLIRSALGFGVDCVIASPDSVDIYNDSTRATQGAIFKIKILKEELTGVIARLKADGVIVYGALPKGGVRCGPVTGGKTRARFGKRKPRHTRRYRHSLRRKYYYRNANPVGIA